MSELRKANTYYPYFLTLTVVGWIDIFTRQRYCDIVIKNLDYCIQQKGLLLYAYVIMLSHIHLVARHPESRLSSVLRDFKRYTAKVLLKSVAQEKGESRKEWLMHMFRYFARHQRQNTHLMFWQKTNHPIELNYPAIIDQKIEYIHNNPVEAGYTLDPHSWVYSSASQIALLPLEPV